MTVLALTHREAVAAKEGLRRTLDTLVQRMAPAPGPLREAIRYEMAWEMRRLADQVIDTLALAVPPQSDKGTKQGHWESISEALSAARIPSDFDDDETLPGMARGTPTEAPPPIDPLCERCRRTIPPGAQVVIVDGGQLCVPCRDEEWER